MIALQCALCGKNQDLCELYPATCDNERISADTYSARRLPDRIHYRIVRCRHCGLIFSSPIFPAQKIARLYHASTCTYGEQIPFVTDTYLGLFDRLRLPSAGRPKVLDVGCGNGFFLEALTHRGIRDAWGVEPGKHMVASASKHLRDRIKNEVFQAYQFPGNSFDVVCCFHALDHQRDPVLFVRETRRLLKPGGYAIVVVHDTDGWSVRLFGERSPIFDIEHIYLFNKTTLRQLFVTHGFAAVSVRDLINTYPLGYWLGMSGLPRGVKSLGQGLLNAVGLARVPFSFPGGNISLIARKPFKP